MIRRLTALLLSSALAAGAAPVRADTVKVLTTGAFKQVVVALVPAFETRTGHRVEVQNDTAGALVKRVAAGEPFDVLVLTPTGLQGLAKEGKVDPASIATLAKVAIGVAVREGAPTPAIDTVEQFRQALLAARKVAYIDPASGGSSGIYLDGLFRRLGVGDEVRAKAVLVPGGLVAERLVTGEADLAIHQISEILPVPGVTLVGPLPESIQNHTTYAGATGNGSGRRQAAQAFLDLLAGPDAAATIRVKGMLPVR
jgi:molybdate transport system substrate-binding protein